MAGLTLVVLAAGLGSRFGGPKQLTPVGPSGEVIFDYSIRDARAAGATEVVLVVNSTIEAAIAQHVGHDETIHLVCQDLDPLARDAADAGRRKPLGTAHATMVGLAAANGAAAMVINADDLYGAEPYRLLAAALHGTWEPGGALVTFPVAHTITGSGSVTRALCDVAGDGALRGIEEGRVDGDEWLGVSGRRVAVDGSEPVSMNFWGFRPGAAEVFGDAARRFVESDRVATDDEVLLPAVVRQMIADGATFTALATAGRCIGVTHPGDLELVRAMLAGGS